MTSSDRYLNLIEQTLRTGANRPRTSRARDDSIHLDDALVACRVALNVSTPEDERLLREWLAGLDPKQRVVDGLVHTRAGYRGILLRSIETADRIVGDSGRVDLVERFDADAWLDAFAGPIHRFTERESLPASDGSAIVEAVWLALGLRRIADRTRYGSLGIACANALLHLARLQQSSGEFLLRSSGDNPEPVWYFELQLLHAIATEHFAHRGEVSEAMLRSARYIAAEVQPDHASSQPWAIHALLQIPEGVHLTDMMLHSAGVQQPSTMDAISLLLLADAAVCLRPPTAR